MTVKVEMQRNPDKQMIALSFESSNEQDLEILDAVRTAMFGDFDKQGTYAKSNQLVVYVKVPTAPNDSE